jgi:lipopolysaccharide biosynthesis glycosyltransferase
MVAIHSIQKNNNEKICFHIYFNTNDNHFINSLSKLITSKGNSIRFLNNDIVESHLSSTLRQHNYITIETYVRLLLPVLIEEDKILYLDPDVIVRNNLYSLFQTDVTSGLAAIPYNSQLEWINIRNKSLGLPNEHQYFNSGVLLLNLSILRESRLFQKALDYLSSHPESNDQDALNLVFLDEYTKLENEYNWTLHDLSFNIDPVIVHFAGPHKPNIKHYIHPYAREFNKHYREIFPNKRYQVSYSYLRNHFFKALIKKILFKLANYLNTFRRT